MRRITDAVRADPVVEEVYRAKSEELGPGTYRFVAEIEFSGSKVVERYLDQGDGAKREQLHGAFIWLFGYLVIWLFGYLVIWLFPYGQLY
jgi:solute carrier family 30 (zinc transporter), member 9